MQHHWDVHLFYYSHLKGDSLQAFISAHINDYAWQLMKSWSLIQFLILHKIH